MVLCTCCTRCVVHMWYCVMCIMYSLHCDMYNIVLYSVYMYVLRCTLGVGVCIVLYTKCRCMYCVVLYIMCGCMCVM